MSKKLVTDFITNELENSSFFPKRTVLSESPLEVQEPKEAKVVKEERPSVRMEGVPPPVPRTVPRPVPLVRKAKRSIKQRQPFDVYWNQYLMLKKISDAEKDYLNGRGMSQMVREALDAYFKAHNIPLEEAPE